MSTDIIDYEKYGISVNTFYGGEEKGRCVQFTIYPSSDGYVQMTYKTAIKFLKEALKKLQDKKINQKGGKK